MSEIEWDIRREGRRWTRAESQMRTERAPEKIEFVGGIFSSDRERFMVLAMILETFGKGRVIQLGRLEDWKAAVAERERPTGEARVNPPQNPV